MNVELKKLSSTFLIIFNFSVCFLSSFSNFIFYNMSIKFVTYVIAFLKIFILFFAVAEQAFSSCGEWGLPSSCGAWASPIVERRL